jgi:hypothetical protein
MHHGRIIELFDRVCSSCLLPPTGPAQRLRLSLAFRGEGKIWLEIESSCDAIIAVIIRCELGRSFRVGVVRLLQGVCIWVRRGRQVVRQRSAKPLSSVRFRPAPPVFSHSPEIPHLLSLAIASKAGIARQQYLAWAKHVDVVCCEERTGRSACATEICSSLHFVGPASKLFLLLTRKGLTLGC